MYDMFTRELNPLTLVLHTYTTVSTLLLGSGIPIYVAFDTPTVPPCYHFSASTHLKYGRQIVNPFKYLRQHVILGVFRDAFKNEPYRVQGYVVSRMI